MIDRTEIWKDIPGYEGIYQISNQGRVKSCDRYAKGRSKLGRWLKGRIKAIHTANNGYPTVSVCKESQQSCFLVHRLIAEAFIPNPLGKKCINHINGVRTDNRIENLEWCTYSENAIHAIKVLKTPFGGTNQVNWIPITIQKTNGTSLQFKSITHAAAFLGCSRGAITNLMNGKKCISKAFEEVVRIDNYEPSDNYYAQ